MSKALKCSFNTKLMDFLVAIFSRQTIRTSLNMKRIRAGHDVTLGDVFRSEQSSHGAI